MITVYGKETCGFCKKATEFLKEKNINYRYTDITQWDDEAKQLLIKTSGMRTIPLIYDKDYLIGGYNELLEYITVNRQHIR